MTNNRLPDEVLLEIFDSYRQNINIYPVLYDYRWRAKCDWLDLAHVCRRWHRVVFSSSSRLDLSITIGPRKPGHINMTLSIHFPIHIEYHYWFGGITGSALWRMRAALRHRDRVRAISFGEAGHGVSFGDFLKATNYHFPALESLHIRFSDDDELDIPATFLRGADRSDLCLRRLELYNAPLAPVSGLLLSATALTDLTLDVSADAEDEDSLQGSFLFTCLQGMQCLRSLHLTASDYYHVVQTQHSTHEDIVPLLKLTHFHYSGSSTFLNDFMSRFSAPSLQDAYIGLWARFPLFYLSRVIGDVREEFWSVSVTFDDRCGGSQFSLSSWTHSEKLDHSKPSFWLRADFFPESIRSINNMPSTKFAMAEELAIRFPYLNITKWTDVFSLREFLRQFSSVRVLRLDPSIREVGLCLQQDDGGGIFPVLEEIELSKSQLTGFSDEEYERRAAEELAAFEPFVSARKRVGRFVKVYHCEQTPSN